MRCGQAFGLPISLGKHVLPEPVGKKACRPLWHQFRLSVRWEMDLEVEIGAMMLLSSWCDNIDHCWWHQLLSWLLEVSVGCRVQSSWHTQQWVRPGAEGATGSVCIQHA